MESATIRPVIGGTRQHARQVGFEVSTEPLDGGTAVVSVIGAVDVATAPALRHALLAAAANRLTEVVIDLTHCSFLDSQGLHALLRPDRASSSLGKRWRSSSPDRDCSRSSESRGWRRRSRSTPPYTRPSTALAGATTVLSPR